MPWWEIIGWTGSVLVVVSLMVPSVRNFRVLNLAGSAIATVYNIVFAIWPYAAMNAVIAVIDIYWLAKLRGSAVRQYRICAIEADSALVHDFAQRHRDAIGQASPGFSTEQLHGAKALLTMFEDEVVGLFVCVVDEGEAVIHLDFVTERYRDFKPGNALYADEAIRFDGVERLVVNLATVGDRAYFERQGFEQQGQTLVRPLGA